MKVIKDIEQGTLEWHKLRLGRVTGTSLEEVMGTPLTRLQLICELIAEEGTEQGKITRPTAEMERGSAEEIFAIKAYSEKFGVKIDQVTICISDEFDWLASSPDGLIADKDGKYTEAIEVKSPDSKTMIFYKAVNMFKDEIKLSPSKQHFLCLPADYKWQIINAFLVNDDLKVMHFVVYDARFIDEEAKMYVIDVKRDEIELQKCLEEVRAALINFRQDWIRYKDVLLPSNF